MMEDQETHETEGSNPEEKENRVMPLRRGQSTVMCLAPPVWGVVMVLLTGYKGSTGHHRESSTMDCYVCSLFPKASDQVTLHAKRMNKSAAKCFASMSGSGYQKVTLKDNDTDPHTTGIENGTCVRSFWVNWGIKVKGKAIPQLVILKGTGNHSMCYQQVNGTIPMGTSLDCDQIAVSGEGAPVKLNAESNGTYAVSNGWWLCGKHAYLTLPAGWTGTCAPIMVSDHTIVVTQVVIQDTKQNRRKKRATLQKHDSIWGTDVPDEFKLWTTDQKVILALFPQTGVGKVMLRVETIDYRLGLYINSSVIINEAQNREISQVRLMAIQSRMALDLLTAAQGGTCVIIGESCCTYVTDEVGGKNMTDALNRLRELSKIMTQDHVKDPGFLGWLMNGGWVPALTKLAIAAGVCLLLFCVFTACIMPCVRAIVNRAIATTVAAVVLAGLAKEAAPAPDPSDALDYIPLLSKT